MLKEAKLFEGLAKKVFEFPKNKKYRNFD